MPSQSLIALLSLVLCGLALSQSLVGEASTIQLDLVFPQNNTSHKPVFPFPVAFAIHNGSDAVSSRDLQLGWWIYRVDPEDPESHYFVDSGGIAADKQRMASIPNEFLLINGTEKLQGRTGKFFLKYRLTIFNNCTLERPPDDLHEYAATHRGNIYFDISKDGNIVDIGESEPCAEPLHAMKIEGYAVHDNISCRVVTDPYPTHMEKCAFPLNDDVHDQIKTEMEILLHCKNHIWPNITEASDCPVIGPNMAGEGSAVGSMLVVILAGIVGFAAVVV